MVPEYIKHQEEQIKNNLIQNGYQSKYDHAGIYCIQANDLIIYVGKSINMLNRIVNHIVEITKSNPREHKYKILKQLQQAGYCLKFNVLYDSPKKLPDAIEKDIGYKEGVFIRKYKPLLNTQIPKVENWRQFNINKKARTITIEEAIKYIQEDLR